MKLTELEPGGLDRWLRRLGSAPRAAARRPLSAASVRLVRQVLSMACEDAVDGGLLGENPVRRTQAPTPGPAPTIGWRAEEASRFLAAAADHRFGAAIHLVVFAVLRRGEVLGLRWSDVDFGAGRVQIAQQLMVERGRARLKPVPERDRGTFVLSPSLVRMLLEHRHRQQSEHADRPVGYGDDLVFRAPDGEPLTPERFTRVIEKLTEQSGVPRITPNGLRRVGSLLAH